MPKAKEGGKLLSGIQRTKSMVERLPLVISKIRDPTLQFLLLITMILVLSGPSLALSFSPLIALAFISTVLAFCLIFFVIDREYRSQSTFKSAITHKSKRKTQDKAQKSLLEDQKTDEL